MNKIEYRMVPKQSFKVIRNCSGCGTKSLYKNTQKFRVNANGNKLDVWLIYQCETCKHTFNLSIYRGQRPSSLPKEEYECFCHNDEELAEKFGCNFQFFKKNKAEVDCDHMEYIFEKLTEVELNQNQRSLVIIQNPYGLKLRLEKQIAEVLELSRSQVKKELDCDRIRIVSATSQLVSFFVDKPTPNTNSNIENPIPTPMMLEDRIVR